MEDVELSELEKVEVTEIVSSRKQDILNTLIAKGVNSLQFETEEDKAVLEAFASQSFEHISQCWGELSDKVKFFIFATYSHEFFEFKKSQEVE